MSLLEQANNKSYGREITFKDLSVYAVKKLNSKDIEKIQENSLSEMEKVERALDDYNSKNGESLSLGEYLVKQLKINYVFVSAQFFYLILKLVALHSTVREASVPIVIVGSPTEVSIV